jgi:galactonate dehydratase
MFDLEVAPHHAQGPVSLMVCAHIDASINNFLIQEFNDTIKIGSPCYRDVVKGGPLINDGQLQLPEAPGLGIDIDDEAAKEYPFKPYDRPIVFNMDGSVGLE